MTHAAALTSRVAGQNHLEGRNQSRLNNDIIEGTDDARLACLQGQRECGCLEVA